MNSEQVVSSNGGIQRSFRMQDMTSPAIITRERSFVRPQSHHHQHFNHPHQLRDGGKRKSMIITTNNRGKPTMEIYRPPSVRVDGVQQQQNKLNVHAKEFTMSRHQNELQNSRSTMNMSQLYNHQQQQQQAGGLHHSKSSGNVMQQSHAVLAALYPPPHAQVLPLITSASASNILHNTPRVHFKLQPQQVNQIPLGQLMHEKKKTGAMNGQVGASMNNGMERQQAQVQPRHLGQAPLQTALKRSKSLTATDTLASGMAALGLTADASDLGIFPKEVQENLDKATSDPNQLAGRALMELVGHVLRRAVESPRYALPAAKACITIIEKERTQTFLESLLNTCQQWYQDRDKVLNVMIGGGRPRLMAFISLLLELFSQLRRRCPLTLATANTAQSANSSTSTISPPARALLTLICKCCEECIRAPVPSASDTENLFFVLTYIGRDLETQLPGELENLLSAVRDAFINTSAAAPSVSKTLLQLIELHASHWQLPGGAVLYYYPSAK